jgi:hypothetical protein
VAEAFPPCQKRELVYHQRNLISKQSRSILTCSRAIVQNHIGLMIYHICRNEQSVRIYRRGGETGIKSVKMLCDKGLNTTSEKTRPAQLQNRRRRNVGEPNRRSSIDGAAVTESEQSCCPGQVTQGAPPSCSPKGTTTSTRETQQETEVHELRPTLESAGLISGRITHTTTACKKTQQRSTWQKEAQQRKETAYR